MIYTKEYVQTALYIIKKGNCYNVLCEYCPLQSVGVTNAECSESYAEDIIELRKYLGDCPKSLLMEFVL